MFTPQGRICQRRFQADMERYLGVPAPSAERDRQIVKDRQVPDKIDIDFDNFSIVESKRLQRVFFEMAPEGQVRVRRRLMYKNAHCLGSILHSPISWTWKMP